MEYQKIRFNHESRTKIINLLTQRELYLNQKPYTKAFYSDPYIVKRFSKPVSFTGHEGCVNTVVWNDVGNLILSGSDDCHLNIWSPFDKPEKPLVHSVPSGHNSNIFSAKFMPKTNDRHIVSCAYDGIVRFTDLNDYLATSPSHSWHPSPEFRCHSNMAFEVLPDPNDPNLFFSCAEDGRINKYDLRISKSCICEHCKRHTFIDLNVNHNPRRRANLRNDNNDDDDDDRSHSEPESEQHRRRTFSFRSIAETSVTAISIRPDNPVYLAAACGDDTVRIYDRRFVRSSTSSNMPYHRDSQVYQFIPRAMRQKQDQDPWNRHRMTSLKYDPHGGGDLCVSYSNDKVYLIRPGAGLIDNPRKMRKGAVMISKKKKRSDSELEIKHSEDNMEIDNINIVKNLVEDTSIKTKSDFVAKEKTGEKNLNDFGQERDTIPTSENFVKDQVYNNDEEILSDQGNQQRTEMQNMDDMEVEEEEHEDDYMYSSDENEEEDSDIEEAYDEDVAMTYTGHLNSTTMIKEAYFYGAKSEYILSGSDDRRIFIWDKLTGKVVNSLIGDNKVVNCVQPHPYYPIICTSGIDNDVKLWYPEGEENDTSNLEEIVRRNEESRQENDWGSSVLVLPLNQVMQLFALFGNNESVLNFE
ncbi:WD40-repeat-containing domain protein [Glomus cerebriforme]|uniref:WD40-repeat-containing domain protein n=1 Tax=Glomus cerebriforme TaxID=658196 RepID=A0A397SYZ3_9GLOM|nr:WD40-repeat-containing domain protein [Glomus cerebriforme]